MANNLLVNPLGAHASVSDFRTMKTADGELLKQGDESYADYRANAAVAKGEAVILVVPTATVPLSVTPMATSSDPRLFAGIAEHAAAAGARVRVCTYGTTEVYVNAQTVAFGDVVLVPGSNTGECSCSSSDPANTVVGGGELGVVLAAKNATTNLAPARIRVV